MMIKRSVKPASAVQRDLCFPRMRIEFNAIYDRYLLGLKLPSE